MEDLDVLNQARNQVLYTGKKNSLVEWTLSDEWSDVTRFSGDKQPRGMVCKCGFMVTLSECVGEI